MKCFYYLQNVQNLLANGKSQIMNEDLGNHSKDQLHYLTHWLAISQNSQKDKAIIH